MASQALLQPYHTKQGLQKPILKVKICDLDKVTGLPNLQPQCFPFSGTLNLVEPPCSRCLLEVKSINCYLKSSIILLPGGLT